MRASERVVARGVDEEAAVFEIHLAILQEIVEHRQHIALGLFDAFDDQNAACGCAKTADQRDRG